MNTIQYNEVIGLVRPAVDAHTLGISYVAKLLQDCGFRVIVGDKTVADALNSISHPESARKLVAWITDHKITRLGFSHRLDPRQAQFLFGRFYWHLQHYGLLISSGGPIRAVYFAGLPEACKRINAEYDGEVPVFCGDETPLEVIKIMGVPPQSIPREIRVQSRYDDMRMNFGRSVIEQGLPGLCEPVDRSGYPEFATPSDHVVKRLDHSMRRRLPPLMRVHVGPYLDRRTEAIQLFHKWIRELRQVRLLDILSIGTSQLTQAAFGEDWGDQPNGGGVPIASESEYRRIWEEARPMLVRTYAGTRNIPQMARIHERSLNIAWHALSFWWFCLADGRGPNTVYENLCQHLETLKYIAHSGKPFEPNIPHHFAFRGGDDVTYVVSAYLAARTAKDRGVRWLVLQNMLNTPKYTSGLQDLAKGRAMLRLLRELEDGSFRVILQPRAGLDFFSPDLDKARVQLAAVSALMDDIEPEDELSPPIIHVVSYSEASHLADPPVINESIRIVRSALKAYREQRRSGGGLDNAMVEEVAERANHLYREARNVLAVIHRTVPQPYTAAGLYRIFAAGFLPAPYLWECRDEFPGATLWQTDIRDGGVTVVAPDGHPIPALVRAEQAALRLPEVHVPGLSTGDGQHVIA